MIPSKSFTPLSSNTSERQSLLNTPIEKSISDQKIEEVVLSVLSATPMSEFEKIYQWDRFDYFTKKCLEELGEPTTEQEALTKRIKHFTESSTKLNTETLDCLFLEGDWMDLIDALAPRGESGFIVYVAKLCQEEVEIIRNTIKKFSKEDIKQILKKVLADKKKMKETKTEFSDPKRKLSHLVNACHYRLLTPLRISLHEATIHLKTKSFSREELVKRGLPGSRNMIPDLLEEWVVKKAMYENVEFYIFEQILKKEVDQLHHRIEKKLKANSKIMKKLGFEETSKSGKPEISQK